MSRTTAHGCQDNPEDTRDVAGHVLGQRPDVRPQLELLVALFEERDHARHVGVRLRQRDARLQPGHGLKVEHHVVHAFELHRQQHVRIGAQEPERGGQHADDLAGCAIDVERFAEDIRGAAKLALPVAVGQDHAQRAARRIVCPC